MEPPSSYAEALRNEQTAQVRTAHRLLVASDELGDVKRSQEPIGQVLDYGHRAAGDLIVDRIGI